MTISPPRLPHLRGTHPHWEGFVVHLPSPRAIVRHAWLPLLEGTVGPAVLFYVVLVLAGFRGALVAALAWAYLAAGRRLLRRERVPGILLLSLALVTQRSVVAFVTGSPFLYFIQPTAGTFIVALLFLGSVVIRRPLAERLARDFCPLDPDLLSRTFVRQFFLRISLLWCAVLVTNAGFVLYLLLASSLHAFVIERTLASAVLTVGGIVLSVLWFLRAMRTAGVPVRWGGAPTSATSPC
ncbi:MAG: hypothetical protein M0020_06795 [Actinomycetota bacterium]|nr:hypothetical protein [Actinomycetota bacterium]